MRKRKARSTEDLPLQTQEDNYHQIDPQLVDLPISGPSQLHTTMIDGPVQPTTSQDTAQARAYVSMMPGSSGIPLDNVRASSNQDEENIGESSGEWAVRIGDEPPPMWGKDQSVDPDPDHRAAKRPRLK